MLASLKDKILQILNSGNMPSRRPAIDINFESNVPGIFIVGDIAGAPVIKLSMEQGYKVIQYISALPDAKSTSKDIYDVIICGAGAAGLNAALEAKEKGLNYLLIEKGKIANTIEEFPEEKWVYSEPESVPTTGKLWFEASPKEDLLKKWNDVVEENNLNIKTGEKIESVLKENENFTVKTEKNTWYAKRVILAIGQRGNPVKLRLKGEELEKVYHNLFTPKAYHRKNILVVGGGNSAVEAALALCEDNKVTISYRKESFFRIFKDNEHKLKEAVSQNKIELLFNSNVKEFAKDNVTVSVKNKDDLVLEYDYAFVLLGAEAPVKFFAKAGIKLENEWDKERWAKLSISCLVVYSIYGITKSLWPFNLLPSSTFYFLGRSPSFWYTVLYTLLVTFYGIKAMKRWGIDRKDRYQMKRYATLITVQWTFLFIIPEFIIYGFEKAAYWRAYGYVLPWPLFFPTFFYNPQTGYIIWGIILAFIVIPIATYWHGKRFCSWICGCGGLAETFGDRWRHLAPKGKEAKEWEKMGTWILYLVSAVTLLYLFKDSMEILKAPAAISHDVYKLVVDVWLVGIIPIALYPFLGGKIWCRYWCPLAKGMELLSRTYGKLKISSNDKCIACSECSRYCLVGIDVMKHALKQESFSNKNTSCIACGVCVTVCPMKCLKFGEQPEKESAISD